MSPEDAEVVRRAREHLARRLGPRQVPDVFRYAQMRTVTRAEAEEMFETRCRWCQSTTHYSPACPARPQQDGRGRR